MSKINEATAFIHVESGAYPLNLNSLRARHTNISFVTGEDVQFFRDLGYEIVETSVRPAGDVVSEGTPMRKEDGTYCQYFEAREFSADEVQNALNNKKDAFQTRCEELRNQALSIGVPIDFGGEDGVQRVQMRNSDRSNILGLKARAEKFIAEGVEGAMIPLRTYENRTVWLTPENTVKVSWIVFDGYSETMQKSWLAIDAAKAAANESQIPAEPADFFPSQHSLIEALGA